MSESPRARHSCNDAQVDLLRHAIEEHDVQFRDQCQQLLLDAARGGSSAAQNELLKTMRPMLVRWFQGRMRRRLKSKVDADDLAQEALIHAWLGFDAFESLLIQQYRKWLKQICRNGLTNTHRHYASAQCRTFDREQPLDDDGVAGGAAADWHSPAADAPLCAAEMEDRLERALTALPEKQRDAFISHELRGESFANIAKRQGCSRNTALAACRSAGSRLASDLADVRRA